MSHAGLDGSGAEFLRIFSEPPDEELLSAATIQVDAGVLSFHSIPR